MYRPEVSVVVWPICWKLACPASLPHSTTWTPDAEWPAKAPDITTLRPAIDGFGDEAMLRLPVAHGVDVQQPVDGQHVVVWQQTVVAAGQHVVWQQIGCTSPDWGESGGGQHDRMGAFNPFDSGQMIRAACVAALAEETIASAQIAAAVTSESEVIVRRITARNQSPKTRESLPIFHNPSAASIRAMASGSGAESAPSPSVARSPRCQLCRPRSSASSGIAQAPARSDARRSSK